MVKQEITKERWEQAQIGEKKCHDVIDLKQYYAYYEFMYNEYFKYLSLDKDLNNKSILEIGPAKISGLLFCSNYKKSYIVEPTKYDDVDHLYEDKDIIFIRDTYEDCESPVVDEIWLLNVLQHVVNPDLFIEKCKKHAKKIVFFEPIDTAINNEHPFSFSEEDYRKYFGDSVTLYNGGRSEFHTAKCVYGIFETDL